MDDATTECRMATPARRYSTFSNRAWSSVAPQVCLRQFGGVALRDPVWGNRRAKP